MKTEKKEACLIFRSLRGAPLAESIGTNSLQLEKVDCETLHLFTSKTDEVLLVRPLKDKLFCQGSPGDCLGLLHLRVNELTTVL